MSRDRVIWVLNAACPSRCQYCDIQSQRAQRELLPAEALHVARELVAAGFRELIFVGGEPLLSPALPALLAELRGKLSVALFTGGVPGDPTRWARLLAGGVDRLVASLDAADESLNDRIRGRPGITRALLDLLAALAGEVDLSFNTVVSRHNVSQLAELWPLLRRHRPASWSLTLAGDNFQGSPVEHLPDLAALAVFYTELVPALARTLEREGKELVVLPTPLSLLERGLAPKHWDAPDVRSSPEVRAEFERFARGAHNEAFVERFGCPLPGRDLSIGVDGSVYPCSQAPILRPEQRLGRLGSGSLTELLARVPAFAAGVPHAPCRRCWAPSNIPRALLAGLMGRA